MPITMFLNTFDSISQHCRLYTVFQKKTPTNIIGYKLRNSCPILKNFDIKIPHNLTSHDSLVVHLT